jgi:nitroreductase
MIAFGFAMLMAEWLGYDTAPMEGFDADAVKRAFEIPKEAEVIALLAIGHVRKPDKKDPGRFPIERLIHSEKFGQPWK